MNQIPSFVKDVNQLRSAAPHLLFVGVEWCRYCQQAKPLLAKVSDTLGTAVPVYYANADKNKDLAKSLDVASFPTIFFVSNQGIYKFEGDRTYNNLVGFVCEHSTSSSHAFCTANV